MKENYMLKMLRVKNGLDEKSVAETVHMPIEEYFNIENNISQPNLKEMIVLSKFYRKTIDELFG